MANEFITRGFVDARIEIRNDGTGRTISGIACPLESRDQIGDPMYGYVETFDRHAFDRTLTERGASKVKLLQHHDMRSNPLGIITELKPDASGLVLEARIANTQAGDETLELIRMGSLDSLSIGFLPVRDKWSNDRKAVRRMEVKLREVSVVNIGALDGASITGVRSNSGRSLNTKLALAKLDLL